jgi:gas vesicle protein
MTTRNGRLASMAVFTAGGLLGAGVALFLAPQSGQRTRQDINHWARTAKNRSEKMLLEARRSTEQLARDVSDRLENQMERGQRLTSEVNSALQSGRDYLRRMKIA